MRHLAHLGYMEITRRREGEKLDALNHNAAADFNWWLVHGGFAVIISYIIMVMGTAVFFRLVVREIKCRCECLTKSKKEKQ